jgi:hypothetical protein
MYVCVGDNMYVKYMKNKQEHHKSSNKESKKVPMCLKEMKHTHTQHKRTQKQGCFSIDWLAFFAFLLCVCFVCGRFYVFFKGDTHDRGKAGHAVHVHTAAPLFLSPFSFSLPSFSSFLSLFAIWVCVFFVSMCRSWNDYI